MTDDDRLVLQQLKLYIGEDVEIVDEAIKLIEKLDNRITEASKLLDTAPQEAIFKKQIASVILVNNLAWAKLNEDLHPPSKRGISAYGHGTSDQ